MKTQAYLLILTCLFAGVLSAKTSNYYAVKFLDKEHNLYTIDKPLDFLSEKALSRREKQGLEVTAIDLPITTGYLYQVKLRGAKVIYTSKWLNTAIITCPETIRSELEKLYFVKEIIYVGKGSNHDIVITEKKKKRRIPKRDIHAFYGKGQNQIDMLNGGYIHNKGKRGRGITIAVLDGGFWRTDDLKVLRGVQKSSARFANRDIVNRDRHVFESSAHGTEVLSVMAANLPGVMVGTAPDADYICLKTEDVRGEFWLDEYTWVVGLEFADSVGVDLIVSSLGYTTFNDSSMDYTYDDLQKNNSISTRAANIAFDKGMIIICSAGNEGENDWKYVSCPADGKGVLAVGAVNNLGERALFASLSYQIGGVMKPDVNALGTNVTVASVIGKNLTKETSGSSYSAPIIAGLVASLWSAFPEFSNQTILDAVKLSTQKSGNDFRLPDFEYAYKILLLEKLY